MSARILVVDQGTSSTRAVVFGDTAAPIAIAQQDLRQIFPQPGHVEHDPEDIWRSTVATAREALAKAGVAPSAVAALGIANQRETTVVWNRASGRTLHNAIVWQDRRTSALCARLKQAGHEPLLRERTGLLLDPYFSATKIAWILDNVPGAREQAQRGELAFGTIDSFLIWRLTNGSSHVTDATNASRTLLYDIHADRWDDDLLALFGVPRSMLPEVRDCSADFGVTAREHLDARIPIFGVAGDQQAAMIGQACFQPGMVKSTFGTGGFVLQNTGTDAVTSKHRLLSTIAYRWSGERTYALEGSIFSAGATVQWLRDGLGIITTAAQSEALAASADPEQRIYFVPAFTGLGAPHWNSEVRGAITGLTRGTTRKEIVRAALESVAYQMRDLIGAMRADPSPGPGAATAPIIRVDGGMSASDWTMQFLADVLDAPVDRPAVLETTALGAAFLAGWRAGVYPGPDEFARSWCAARRFTPAMGPQERESRYLGWRDAIARATAPPVLE